MNKQIEELKKDLTDIFDEEYYKRNLITPQNTAEKLAEKGYRIMSKDFIENEIYPLTITADRYNGTYSGGQYTAWNLLAEDVPPEVDGDDITCYEFWQTNEIICGKGGTVTEAISDLYFKLKEGVEE